MDRESSPRIFVSRAARNRFILHAIVVTVVFVALVVLFRARLGVLTDSRAIRTTVTEFGRLAPLVLIALQAIQVVVAPIPAQALAAVAGYLFGPWCGTLYNMIGITIGSTAAFWLSRRFGRSYVEGVIDETTLAAVDDYVERHGLVSLFVLFLIPGLPDDALCFVGGLTQIPLWKLVVIATVGRAPAFFLVNVFGDMVAQGNGHSAVALLAVIVGLSVAGYLGRDRIIRFFGE
ncbi:Membrane protein DegA family [Halanaeroarchaeum sp. HSR-CO]|uniref:TVP38/TMEM64 family protein n=1 Tax=Halanaeroarchaeum sp. HSR-CO TaxID=2866382 RepID=UPI00217DC7A9|nr:TVP38/TMEM64 family protein [Halanaeroarchaeum sp. HSR-CO]UWG46782.1 Membrane protein DegA family [Halanaeroarchaeum sp. HSR-CO]